MAEKERIDLLKQVYSKSEYTKIIDTSFSELGVESIPNQLNNTFTVSEFFQKYDELFYDIPAEGDINSHAYLVETSGEYIGFDKDNELITALQQEIAQLRKDLLAAEIARAEAITGEKIDINPDNITVDNDSEFNQIRNDLTSQIDPNAVTPTVVSDTPANSNSNVINPSSPTPAPSTGGGGGGGGY
tara:strand:- start:6530 stop:7090 length:561 start_codon:yes stop_codon:yes gene_type:complete